jgi:hypothetical protein
MKKVTLLKKGNSKEPIRQLVKALARQMAEEDHRRQMAA